MTNIISPIKYFLYIILIIFFASVNSIFVYGDSGFYEVEIILENHKFTPSEVHVPKERKLKLIIDNRDDAIEEFESRTLKREKILQAHAKTNIILAPLKAGRYDFIGEFHEESAKGVIISE